MGLFDWVKKKTEIIESTKKPSLIEIENWIDVHFVYDEEVISPADEKKIRVYLAKECTRLLEIFMNQEEIEISDKESRIHINPSLHGDGTLTTRGFTIAKTKRLKRNFFPEFKKVKGNNWKIIIKADKKYSPQELIEDMPSLVNLNAELTKYLNIGTNLHGTVLPAIEIDKNKNPLYQERRSMLVITCKVKDRIELAKFNKKLDADLFNGQGISEFINETKEMKSKSKEDFDWIKAVDKINNSLK